VRTASCTGPGSPRASRGGRGRGAAPALLARGRGAAPVRRATRSTATWTLVVGTGVPPGGRGARRRTRGGRGAVHPVRSRSGAHHGSSADGHTPRRTLVLQHDRARRARDGARRPGWTPARWIVTSTSVTTAASDVERLGSACSPATTTGLVLQRRRRAGRGAPRGDPVRCTKLGIDDRHGTVARSMGSRSWPLGGVLEWANDDLVPRSRAEILTGLLDYTLAGRGAAEGRAHHVRRSPRPSDGR
jgi:hypothetical protein